MMQSLFTTLAAAALFLTPLSAAETPQTISPWDKDDGQWITIAGKITKVTGNDFTLDYGEGAILVEVDSYRKKPTNYRFAADDKVIVTGRVDADKDQKRSIEAGSVYVKNEGKSYFAEADDEEEVITKLRKVTNNGTGVVVTGKVTSQVRNFLTINTGYQTIKVSTEVLPANSFNSEGLLPLEEGDTITVYGAITDGFSEGDKLVASHVVKR